MAEKVIDIESKMQECIKYLERHGYIDDDVKDIAIEVIRKQINGGWIPCSERMPEDGQYILLSFSNFSLPLVGRYEEDKEGGAFFIGDDDISCVQEDLFVNAWQPLPEPYKEA